MRIYDLAGRPRGTGFVADHHGMVLTSHEAVDGLDRLVLRAPGGRPCAVTADEVTPLAALDLALVRTDGLGLAPLPVMVRSGVLALLVPGARARARHLPQALERFVAGDPHLPASALVPALAMHADQVLDAFRLRLRSPRPDSGEVLRTLADVTTPVLARQVAALVREVVELRPEAAGHVAVYVDRRLEHGPGARGVLFPLVAGLLAGGPAQVRAALAGVLAVPDTPASGGLRRELLDLLLASERDPAVLEAVLRARGARCAGRAVAGTAERRSASSYAVRGSSSSAPPKAPPVSTGDSWTSLATSRASPCRRWHG